jgi:hypothetical protein
LGVEKTFVFSVIFFLVLTNDQKAFLGEIVGGNLEVEGGRSLSYATRNVVVGTVARAEPATEVTGLTDGDTTKMGADTCRNTHSY